MGKAARFSHGNLVAPMRRTLPLTALVQCLESIHMNKWAPYVVDSQCFQSQQSQLIWAHQFHRGLLGAIRWASVLTTQSARTFCSYKARKKVTANQNPWARLASELSCIFSQAPQTDSFKKWACSDCFATPTQVVNMVKTWRDPGKCLFKRNQREYLC